MAKTPSQGSMSSGTGTDTPGFTASPPEAGMGMNTGVGSGMGSGMGSGLSESSKGLMSQATEKLRDTAEDQKAAGANFMADMAGAVRRAAGEFEGQVPQAADYIRYAADQMDSMSEAIRRRDIGQMMSDLQGFARNQPTAFLGATFLAGFAAMRFFKSSAGSSSQSQSAAAMRAPSSGRYGDTGRYGETGYGAGQQGYGGGMDTEMRDSESGRRFPDTPMTPPGL